MTSPHDAAPAAGSRPSNLALYYDNAAILRDGHYIQPETHTIVDLSGAVAASCAAVVAYDTAATERALWEQSFPRRSRVPPIQTAMSVTEEKSTAAAARLVANGAPSPIAMLNYANAEEPGGGYTRGARAQEEDLRRTSALYTTLITPAALPFYAAHTTWRGSRRDHYFSHSAVYSPAVPVFRDDDYKLLDTPFVVDFITAAAPYSCGRNDPKPRLARLFHDVGEDRSVDDVQQLLGRGLGAGQNPRAETGHGQDRLTQAGGGGRHGSS